MLGLCWSTLAVLMIMAPAALILGGGALLKVWMLFLMSRMGKKAWFCGIFFDALNDCHRKSLNPHRNAWTIRRLLTYPLSRSTIILCRNEENFEDNLKKRKLLAPWFNIWKRSENLGQWQPWKPFKAQKKPKLKHTITHDLHQPSQAKFEWRIWSIKKKPEYLKKNNIVGTPLLPLE